jgi:hypothetical protein
MRAHLHVMHKAGFRVATAGMPARTPLGTVIVASKFKCVVIVDDVWSILLPPSPVAPETHLQVRCVAAASRHKLHFQRCLQVFSATRTWRRADAR